MKTTTDPIDLEFALLRAAYVEEEVAALRHAVQGYPSESTTHDRAWANLLQQELAAFYMASRQSSLKARCKYCRGSGVYQSGTWAGFCSHLCWTLFVEDRR